MLCYKSELWDVCCKYFVEKWIHFVKMGQHCELKQEHTTISKNCLFLFLVNMNIVLTYFCIFSSHTLRDICYRTWFCHSQDKLYIDRLVQSSTKSCNTVLTVSDWIFESTWVGRPYDMLHCSHHWCTYYASEKETCHSWNELIIAS